MKVISYRWAKALHAFRPSGAIALFLIFAAVIILPACSKKEPKPTMPPAPVQISTVTEKDMPLQIKAIGNVQAFSTVNVKSQLDGQIFKVNFQEGQTVKKGDLLFEIDPRPFQAALEQAEANLAKDTALEQQYHANLTRDIAQAKYARAEAERYSTLVEHGVVTKEVYEDKRTSAESLDATVNADRAAIQTVVSSKKADQAAIDNAKVQLGYCSIKAPIDGKLGSLLIHQGNLVKANDTISMVVLNQIKPIYAAFSVPQQNLPDIKKYMAAGKLKVEGVLPDGQRREGTLTFLDNNVDQTTGTIQLKATFPNDDSLLWPGQFINVSLDLANQPNAIVAPAQAIQNGQQGQYVYVLKDDMTVENRPVVLGKGTETEAVIVKGLKPGEKVVVNGQLRLSPGAKVEITGSTDSKLSSNATGGESGR